MIVKRLQAGDLAHSFPLESKLTVAGPLRNTSRSTSPDSPSISCPCDGLPETIDECLTDGAVLGQEPIS
jgi:hypothetical protein